MPLLTWYFAFHYWLLSIIIDIIDYWCHYWLHYWHFSHYFDYFFHYWHWLLIWYWHYWWYWLPLMPHYWYWLHDYAIIDDIIDIDAITPLIIILLIRHIDDIYDYAIDDITPLYLRYWWYIDIYWLFLRLAIDDMPLTLRHYIIITPLFSMIID
jgi:hypothetical protein